MSPRRPPGPQHGLGRGDHRVPTPPFFTIATIAHSLGISLNVLARGGAADTATSPAA
ncbi:hypothetical protein OHA77_39235 [Streptosporangium sp. NBC_01639]|uniref:hypothetical protein n=1 Tax=Streptosporangium sp. NBC_01639 TaxID=2975948 RepID=UPI00386CBDCD|nr:hypothetical protein OHA77_39235 [Streptosporangium sp. NBC_01639]